MQYTAYILKHDSSGCNNSSSMIVNGAMPSIESNVIIVLFCTCNYMTLCWGIIHKRNIQVRHFDDTPSTISWQICFKINQKGQSYRAWIYKSYHQKVILWHRKYLTAPSMKNGLYSSATLHFNTLNWGNNAVCCLFQNTFQRLHTYTRSAVHIMLHCLESVKHSTHILLASQE